MKPFRVTRFQRGVQAFFRAAWPVLLAYVTAFLLILGASSVLVLGVALSRLHGQFDPQRMTDEALHFALSAPGILAAAAISGGIFVLVAGIAASLLGPDVMARLRLGPTRGTAVGYTAAVFGVVGLSVALSAASDLVGVAKTGTMQEIASSLSHPTPVVFALAILLVGVLPGIAEETFFRGFAQTRLVSNGVGRWPAIVTTAFLFGLIHLDPVQSPLAFGLALFLGWTVERLGGIRPSILAHAVNNALFVVASCTGADASSARNGWREDAVAIAAGAAVVLLATAVMRSSRAVRELPVDHAV
jgi:membrane protease YdiL (CAAX protease family)